MSANISVCLWTNYNADQMIIFQNETCYCLTTFPKLKKVSGSFCQKTCPGNTNEVCGGSGKLGYHEYINIYNHGIDDVYDVSPSLFLIFRLYSLLHVSFENNAL